MNRKPNIYLDHAATTPIDPRVLEHMTPFLTDQFGNASSVHSHGRKARLAVEEAREQIADFVGAAPSEIVFTSGGTESDNLAVRGLSAATGGGWVVSAGEHEAVLRSADALSRSGVTVCIAGVDVDGSPQPGSLASARAKGVTCASFMHVNNETGYVTDLKALSAEARQLGMTVHSDAVQSIELFDVNVDDLGVDLLTASSHKIYGPKGAGVLYVRGGVELLPQLEGGMQERRRRAGTENVAAIVGMATAWDLAVKERSERRTHVRGLRSRLVRGLDEMLGDRLVHNSPREGAAHIVNVAFPPIHGEPIDGEMLLLNLDVEGVSVSSGSACTSGTVRPSHVLEALGRDVPTASAAVRFSIGKDNTEAEIDYAIEALAKVLRRMRRSTAAVD